MCTQTFLHGYFRRTCFVQVILADLGPCGELLTKQTSFFVQPYARLTKIALQNFASTFSPATISKVNVSARHWVIFKRDASEPTQDKLNRDKMTDMTSGRSARRRQLAVVMYKSRVSDQNGISLLYIMLDIHRSGREPSNRHINFNSKFRRISKITSGTTKKPEFRRKPDDSHP